MLVPDRGSDLLAPDSHARAGGTAGEGSSRTPLGTPLQHQAKGILCMHRDALAAIAPRAEPLHGSMPDCAGMPASAHGMEFFFFVGVALHCDSV